jgi:hypothetical protein
MGLLGPIAGAGGRLGTRTARRSRWLARRLWLLALAESGWAAWRHWRRLEPPERDRLLKLARKSRGRPSRLSAHERDEVDRLLERMGHLKLIEGVAATWLPFGWLSRIVTRTLGPRARLGAPGAARSAARSAESGSR